jgi:hypothetical protein
MQRLSSSLFPVALLALTTACTDDPEPTPEPEVVDTAAVRVIHASPDAPEVDVWVVGLDEPVFESLGYGDTTAYADLPEGNYTIELRGAGSDGSSAAAYTQELRVPESGEVTAIAMGLLGSSETAESFRIQSYIEGFETPAMGTARVRIIHGSPTAPAVALDVGNDGVPEISDLVRFGGTGIAGVELPAETELQIGIWAGEPLSRVTAFTTPALPDGGEWFVIATGVLEDLSREDTGFSLLAVDDMGTIGFVKQNPVVYALHGSPDAPAVDIYAGGAELVDDLAFTEISDPIQVPPGSYTLDFHGHTMGSIEPTTDPAATEDTPALMAGESYLAIATGFLADTPAFQLLPVAESFDVSDANARLRVVHASPDAPAVDVGTVSGGVLTPVADYEALDFTDTSSGAGVSLPAGTYDIGIGLAGSTSPLFTFSGLGLTDYDRYTAVAIGSVASGSFQLVLVDKAESPWVAIPIQPDAE